MKGAFLPRAAYRLFLLVLSYLIVTFGQPHKSILCSFLAGSLGFALFWLAISPLQGRKKRFLANVLWFVSIQLVQLSWMANATYQGKYIFGVYLGLSIWMGIQFGLFSLFFPWHFPLSIRRILCLGSLWTIFEWGRLWFFCGFIWNPVGLALSFHPIPSQLAACLGVFGLSLWVILTNLFAFNWLMRPSFNTAKGWVLTLLFPYFFGFCHLKYHEWSQTKEPSKQLNVALVQPSLFPDQKVPWQDKLDRFVHPLDQWTRMIPLLENSHQSIDLIVLPEAAVYGDANLCIYPYLQVVEELRHLWKESTFSLSSLLSPPYAKKEGEQWFVNNLFWVQALATHYGAEVVIGLIDSHDPTGEVYNAAFHVSPDRKIFRVEKRILLPLAEYIPFSWLKPFTSQYGIDDSFTPGKSAKVLGKSPPFSISICHEECFGWWMRQARKKGAELFVNITNDGWFPDSDLPRQHFIHSYLRTIENGIPLVRSCNTGLTVAVDSLGRVKKELIGESGEIEGFCGVLMTPLDLYHYPTLYTIWGDFFVVGFCMVCMSWGLFLQLSRLSRRKEVPLLCVD